MEWLAAIEAWPWVAALRDGRWSYAAVNAAHILGLSLLVGSIVALDLRLIGLWPKVPLQPLARVLAPVAACGLALAALAGLALFSVRAQQYAATPLFVVKMALVAAGVVNAALLHGGAAWRSVVADDRLSPMPLRLRVSGALSIAIWLSVLMCGRLLGFVEQ